VEVQRGRQTSTLPPETLAPENSEPVAYMASRIRTNTPIAGLTGIDINVKVIRIIDLAKESVKTGRAVPYSQ
jgi:hypothetical protein